MTEEPRFVRLDAAQEDLVREAWDTIDMIREAGLEDTSPDALRKGDRVEKAQTRPGDTHQNGALATVEMAFIADGHRGAFVRFDSHPHIPVFVVEGRVRRVRE